MLAHSIRSSPLVRQIPQHFGQCVQQEKHYVGDGQVEIQQQESGLETNDNEVLVLVRAAFLARHFHSTIRVLVQRCPSPFSSTFGSMPSIRKWFQKRLRSLVMNICICFFHH